MKPRYLHTQHDVVIRNYQIDPRPLPNGRFRHSFNPLTTATVYEFEASSNPVLTNGDRYSIGYEVVNGRNIIDVAALGLAGNFNKWLSFGVAQQYSTNILVENKSKNDTRVMHTATDGDYYWGKKYAWRRYGLFVAKNAFYSYLDEIGHPSIPCVTSNPDLGMIGNENSVAYADAGLAWAAEQLVSTAVPNGRYFTSALYSKKFQIRAIEAITDKK